MLIARIPRFIAGSLKNFTWEIPTEDKCVYITFDDGPTPAVTDWVLNQLELYDSKATFFCLGKNVERYPEIYKRITEKGHAVGNHSFSHLKGFRTPVIKYLDDVNHASEYIDSTLFRPPYGRILPAQAKQLSENYRIIMWSVLSVDYNGKISPEKVVRNVIRNVKPGSIIVFHDSLKASKNLYPALPIVLGYLKRQGYTAKPISV